MPLPPTVTTAPGLRARRHLDLDVAVERRGAERRAQRGDRRRHVEHGHEVVAVAQEALVGLHVDEHVEVAGRPAALARVPAPGEADALPVADAGGHVDAQRAPAHLAPAPVALRARLLGDAPLAAAHVAGDLAHDLPEGRARHRLQHAGAAAALAGDDRRAGLGAVAVAALAGVDGLEAELDLGAGRGLRERDLGADGDVAALHRAAARGGAERAPKNASKRSEIEPKPSKLGAKPPERRPSWP